MHTKPYFFFISLCLYIGVITNNEAASFPECHQPLTLSSTTDWYPYIYQQGEASHGADVELLRLILETMGCQLEVLHFPERRSLFELDAGNFDIGLGASYTPERAEKFNFSTSYRLERNRFVYRTDDRVVATIKNLDDIIAAKKLIAINLAGWYGDEIEQAKTIYNGFIFSDTVGKRLKMLAYNRVDLVIDDDIVLCSELNRSMIPDLAIHPYILSSADIHFIFNKQTITPVFIASFNRILGIMLSSGEVDDLYLKQLPANCVNPDFTQ